MNNPIPQPNSAQHTIPLSKAHTAYLLNLRSQKVSEKHFDHHQRVLAIFIRRFGDLDVASVRPEHLRAWLIWLRGEDTDPQAPPAPAGRQSRALTSAAVDGHWRSLKAFFGWMEREEILPRSPFQKVQRPRVDEVEPDVLTELEVRLLLDCVRTSGDPNAYRDYCIHLMFLDTGIRMNELRMLDVDDADLETGLLTVRHGKGNRKRIKTFRRVEMGAELCRAVSLYQLKHRRSQADERALFVTDEGRRMQGHTLQHMVVKDLKKYVGRKLNRSGPHTLRHTALTLEQLTHGDIERTRRKAGHTTVRTTERYIHLGETFLRKRASTAMDQVLQNGGLQVE